MKNLFSKKAQSLTEVALILATVGLAFIGMEVYVRRGVQARIKDLSDNIIGKKHSGYSSSATDLSVFESSTDSAGASEISTATSIGGVKETRKFEGSSSYSEEFRNYSP
jgi:hypothetical protein